jgi:hypothetical protein
LYIEANDNLWIGDARYGLVRDTKSGTESLVPNGPSTNKAFKMVNAGTIIYSIPGGYTRDFNKQNLTGAINTFSEEAWRTEKFQEFTDLSDILVDPNNSNHLYVGTWGQGMLEIRDGKIINQFMEANSKLEQYNQKGVRVHNLVDDEQGNLWMVNFGTENPIKFLDGEGKWKAFEYETLKGKIPGGLISATNGYKWGFIHDSPNLFVIDDFDTPANIKDDKVLIVEPKDFNGTSFTDEIYAIVEDQEGNLWIATDEGISVDFEPGNVFQRDIYQPSRIRITREGYTQYMLRDNYVTDMAADPANQIWFATKTAGVFVYNPDKQTVVDHFTSRNSPLLTDTIQALTINKKGEVFISTSKGIISYRSETSEGREDFSETYAFPNPVPPDYSGIITITNLVEDVNVKITDISGNLVYETIANGGQATWNGKNFSGQRVSSGVYLIFLTNEDGSKTHVEKLLFIK